MHVRAPGQEEAPILALQPVAQAEAAGLDESVRRQVRGQNEPHAGKRLVSPFIKQPRRCRARQQRAQFAGRCAGAPVQQALGRNLAAAHQRSQHFREQNLRIVMPGRRLAMPSRDDAGGQAVGIEIRAHLIEDGPPFAAGVERVQTPVAVPRKVAQVPAIRVANDGAFIACSNAVK